LCWRREISQKKKIHKGKKPQGILIGSPSTEDFVPGARSESGRAGKCREGEEGL